MLSISEKEKIAVSITLLFVFLRPAFSETLTIFVAASLQSAAERITIIHGGGVNSFTCRVIQAVENPFSFTVMLLAKENASPIFWEADKNLWREIKSETVRISLPPENLLLLKE